MPEPTIPPRGYLRVGEVAALLGVSPQAVNSWARQGLLPHTRTLGGHRRYPAADVHRLARALRQPPAHDAAGELEARLPGRGRGELRVLGQEVRADER